MWGRGEGGAGGAVEVIVVACFRLHVSFSVYLKRGGLDCQINLTEDLFGSLKSPIRGDPEASGW